MNAPHTLTPLVTPYIDPAGIKSVVTYILYKPAWILHGIKLSHAWVVNRIYRENRNTRKVSSYAGIHSRPYLAFLFNVVYMHEYDDDVCSVWKKKFVWGRKKFNAFLCQDNVLSSRKKRLHQFQFTIKGSYRPQLIFQFNMFAIKKFVLRLRSSSWAKANNNNNTQKWDQWSTSCVQVTHSQLINFFNISVLCYIHISCIKFNHAVVSK